MTVDHDFHGHRVAIHHARIPPISAPQRLPRCRRILVTLGIGHAGNTTKGCFKFGIDRWCTTAGWAGETEVSRTAAGADPAIVSVSIATKAGPEAHGRQPFIGNVVLDKTAQAGEATPLYQVP